MVIDQHQVSTDQRSGITSDPESIVRFLGQVITVSVETVKVVNGLPRRETGARSRGAGELQC
jgi:predicted helicase